MDTETIKAISRQIHRQFPELAGEQPLVRTQVGAKSAGSATYLLTFKGRAASSGPNLARTVRVVADEHGKVLKVTTSR